MRLLIVALLFWAIPCFAILGDLNRDGVVDFDDFFLFADNFGKIGTPEPPDTVYITQIDTLYLGLSEIPSAPVVEDQTSIEVVQSSLYVDGRKLYGEIVNNAGTTYESVTIRFVLRDTDGVILAVKNFHSDPDIYVFAPGDRRPFYFSSVTGLNQLSDVIERGTFSFDWQEISSKLPSNDLVLLPESVPGGSNISGEIKNIGDGTAEFVRIMVVSTNNTGQVLETQLALVNFGDPLGPGETGTFETYSLAENYQHRMYFINWNPYTEHQATPYASWPK